LLEALQTETIDEQLITKLLRKAKALGEIADSKRKKQEQRLKALGFEKPSDDQQRKQLAKNIALLDWPKSLKG
jgi:hypothetical protein